MDLAGRVVTVTGGFGSLGGAVVRAVAAAGGRVAAVDQAASPSAPLPADAMLVGGVDLTSLAAAEQALARVAERFGALDALVNVAGTFRWETMDDADLAIIDKRRPKANVATVMNIIGDVDGKTCVLVDDIVDTAGTLCAAAAALKERGARKVVAYCVHPVLSGAAIRNVEGSQLDQLVVTNTLPLRPDALGCPKIRQLSVAELLAETIRRIAFGESVSSLYVD